MLILPPFIEEISNLLEIQGASPFRIRTYRNAARAISELSQGVYLLVKKDADLTRLPSIGDDLSAKIKEIVSTGRCSLLQRLHKELPPAIANLLKRLNQITLVNHSSAKSAVES